MSLKKPKLLWPNKKKTLKRSIPHSFVTWQMKNKFLLKKLKQVGKRLGFKLINASDLVELLSELMKYREGGEHHGEWGVIEKRGEHDFPAYVLQNYNGTRAQLFQDLFVLFLTKEKRNGYFVEFGAANGLLHSNTHLLETVFEWNGILAEPARCWHNELYKNRRCLIEKQCVWKNSGELLEFCEVEEGGLSTIAKFSALDWHSEARKQGNKYTVESISLNDLLTRHAAPQCIDYLSVDTEGSELEILSQFDFSKYDIRIITVEHNYTPNREKIQTLLQVNGYRRVFESFSRWDDWYVKVNLE
jgi:FkbM family methyltransferase